MSEEKKISEGYMELQWGRAVEGAETCGITRRNGGVASFNGAAPLKARKHRAAGLVDGLADLASMGPRR